MIRALGHDLTRACHGLALNRRFASQRGYNMTAMSRKRAILGLLALICALLGIARLSARTDTEASTSRPAALAPLADARASGTASLSGPACSSATGETLAAVDGNVAERIYRDELKGTQTIADRRQVEEYGPLLAALSEGKRSAVRVAVSSLVYSHTHIVRLRVSQGGSLLADVGGPYIIAPVGGNLYLQGRLVGRYLLSVQDDLGFVGLEKRLIGMPLVLDVNHARIPLSGTVEIHPVTLPARGPVLVRRVTYQAYGFDAKAYPSGTLHITVLIPPQHASARSCAAVEVAEYGRVTQRIWSRFVIDKAPLSGFVGFAQSHTGASIYVKAGSRLIAGSTRTAPARLPHSGAIILHGRPYGVSSFAASSTGRLRVYELIPLS